MLSQSLQPPFQLQSILKQTHINMQDQPNPCKKRKKKTQQLHFSISSFFLGQRLPQCLTQLLAA